jgi:hypothetical protein
MFGTPRSFAPPGYLNALDPSTATPLGNGFSLSPVAPAQPVSNSPFGADHPGATVRLGPRSVGMFASRAAPGMDSINAALARNAALGQQKADHRKKVLGDIGGALAAGLNGYLAAMGNPAGIEGLRSMHEMQLQRQRDAADAEQERLKLMAPRVEQVGNSIGYLDPSAGTFDPIYRDPQAFEAYATSLGFTPGTPEYENAVENYRLGAWSDPAVAAKSGLIDRRYDRSDAQLGRRLDVTKRGQDLQHEDRQATIRQSDTNNRRTSGQSNTNSQRSAETARGAYSYTHGSRGHSRAGDEPVAVGPDGKRYVVRNGQWVPIN